MEIDHLYVNFVEGSIWRGSSSYCGQVPFLLQTLGNKPVPWLPSIHYYGQRLYIDQVPSLVWQELEVRVHFCLRLLGREPCGRWQGPICPLLWGLREPSSWSTSLPFLLSLHFFLFCFLYVFIYTNIFFLNSRPLLVLQVLNDHP